ncbi:MAG TPA: hypothetical protein VGE07_06325, partial [Herpetosiphonaceae bacterium]
MARFHPAESEDFSVAESLMLPSDLTHALADAAAALAAEQGDERALAGAALLALGRHGIAASCALALR